MKSREKAGKEGVVEKKLGNDTDGAKVRKRKGYEETRTAHINSLGPLGLVKHKLSDKVQTGQIRGVKKRKAKSTSDNRKVSTKNRMEEKSLTAQL